MDIDAGIILAAATTTATVIVMILAILTLRRQIRKDAASAQGMVMREFRHIAGDLERRHEADARTFREAVRILHERVDRKERDSRTGDERLDRRLDAMQETMRDLSEIKGEVKAIRTQITVIQHGLQGGKE